MVDQSGLSKKMGCIINTTECILHKYEVVTKIFSAGWLWTYAVRVVTDRCGSFVVLSPCVAVVKICSVQQKYRRATACDPARKISVHTAAVEYHASFSERTGTRWASSKTQRILFHPKIVLSSSSSMVAQSGLSKVC